MKKLFRKLSETLPETVFVGVSFNEVAGLHLDMYEKKSLVQVFSCEFCYFINYHKTSNISKGKYQLNDNFLEFTELKMKTCVVSSKSKSHMFYFSVGDVRELTGPLWKSFSETFLKVHKNILCWSVFQGRYRPRASNLWKQESGTSLFLQILLNFSEQMFAKQLWTATSEYWDVLLKINDLKQDMLR